MYVGVRTQACEYRSAKAAATPHTIKQRTPGGTKMHNHLHSSHAPRTTNAVSIGPTLGGGPAGLVALEELGISITVPKNAELWAQGESTPYAYRIVSGSVRLVKLMPDGRRQITDFLTAGEWLGFEGPAEHDYAAEAIVGSVVRRYPRRHVDALVAQDIGLARWRLELMSNTLCQAQDRMLTLGRRTAAERLAVFLLDMSARAPAGQGGEVTLPMSRADIGDYLGLRLETVSRTMAQMQRSGAIRLSSAGFSVRNRGALDACAGATLD
jgi:CRP-like cAMP-binding protein